MIQTTVSFCRRGISITPKGDQDSFSLIFFLNGLSPGAELWT